MSGNNVPVTDAELDHAEQVERMATEGPWVMGEADPLFPVTMGGPGSLPLWNTWFKSDVRFIVLARTMLPRLVATGRARRAPVVVDDDIIDGIAIQIRAVCGFSSDFYGIDAAARENWRKALRPIVEGQARLARECADLRETFQAALHAIPKTYHGYPKLHLCIAAALDESENAHQQLKDAREQLEAAASTHDDEESAHGETLKLLESARAEINDWASRHAQACVEVERLREELRQATMALNATGPSIDPDHKSGD